MNISIAIIKDYDSEQRTINDERHSKQTQYKPNSNPNKPNFQKAKLNLNLFGTKDYEKTAPSGSGKTNPIQTQFPKE